MLVLAELTSHVDAPEKPHECLSPNHLCSIIIIIICAYYLFPAKQNVWTVQKKCGETPDGHNRKVIPADDGLSAL